MNVLLHTVTDMLLFPKQIINELRLTLYTELQVGPGHRMYLGDFITDQ